MSTPSNRHSRFELKTLLETSNLIIESHDLDFVLNNLLLISMGKLMIPSGMILLHQPVNNNYIVSKSKGKNSLPEGQKLSLNATDELKKESVITDCKNSSVIPVALKKNGVSILFNLHTTNNHIGILCLGTKTNNQPMLPHEKAFIESLSIISSSAIVNSRLFSELRQTNRMLDRKVYELNTLFELSKDFNLMSDRSEIIRILKFTLLGQLMIKKFFFILEEQKQRNVVASSGIEETFSEDLINKLFALEQDLIEVDAKLAVKIPFLKKHNIKAVIALHFQKEKIALIGIGTRAGLKDNDYETSDYHFLRSLSNLAVLSIQKTYLLKEYIEKERLEEELTLANNIQQGLFPDPIPACDQLDISAQNISSSQVGGDYYDILETPDHKFLFAIGDVSGKGAPAALLMANLQAMLHLLLPMDSTLSKNSERINDIIYKNTPDDKFITFFWGVFDPENYAFHFVNAGHNAPLWFRTKDQEVQKLTEGGLIFGAMPTTKPYQEVEIDLSQGDLLVFYTDGITEALNKEGTLEFGENRLINCLKENRNKPAKEINQAVLTQVQAFSSNSQTDDITLIVVKVV